MILLEYKFRKYLKYTINIIIVLMVFMILKTSYIKMDSYFQTKKETNYQNTLFSKYKIESAKQKKDLKEFFDFIEYDLDAYLIEFDYKYPLSPEATVLIVTEKNAEFKTRYDFNIASSFSLQDSQITILNVRGD